MSRVLFIVLIGCAIAFGSPVKRETEENIEVNKPYQQQVQEAIHNVLTKIGQAIREVLRALFNLIQQGFNSEEIKNAIQNLKAVLEKAFNEGLEGHFDLANGKDIQEAIKELIKRACYAYKEFLTSFFNKIEEHINDEELKKSIEELKQLLKKIYNYQEPSNIRRINFAEDESVHELTQEEHTSIGFKETVQKIIEVLLKQFIESLTEEEKQQLKDAILGDQQSSDF